MGARVRAEMGLLCNGAKKVRGAVVGKGFVPPILRTVGTFGKKVRSFIFVVLKVAGVVGMARCERVRSFVFVYGRVGFFISWRVGRELCCVDVREGRLAWIRSSDVAELLIFWHMNTTGANIFRSGRRPIWRRKCLASVD